MEQEKSRTQKHILAHCFFLSVLFFLFGPAGQTQLYAQYSIPQNDVWAFGYGQGVNFLPGPAPVSLPSSTNTYEGSAAVCDNTGHLLFYSAGSTTGTFVYDRTGAVMPHGTGIVPWPTYSCTQAAEIVPVIGNPNQYYLFSLEQGGSSSWGGTPGFCHLYYCIVDMTLNGGLGDVVASTISTPLDSGLCEKMTAVAGNNCNIWLLTHEKDLPIFKAYSITSAGISAPVLSTSTGEVPSFVGAYKIGTIKVSPDRTMIANVMLDGVYGGGDERLELLQFNATTGIATGCQVLNSFGNQYDGEFSPDNSKFYVRVLGGSMYQYDLSLMPSISAVIASQNIVYTSADWGGQMKLGPDGKIYAQTNVGFLDCISSPNLLGSLCNYTPHAVSIGSTGIGMPNMEVVVNAAIAPDTNYAAHDTSLCAVPPITLTAPSGYGSYVWNNASTATTLNAMTSGTYWVTGVGSCSLPTLIDTFHVTFDPVVTTSLASDSSICILAGSMTLNAPTGYTSQTWSTGSTGTSITVTTSGTYWVINAIGCTDQIDTFHVTFAPVVTTTHAIDTSACAVAGSITLTAPGGYTAQTWSTGGTGSTISVSANGTYYVTSTIGCTAYVDTIHVSLIPSPTVALGNDTAFCIGAAITLGSHEQGIAQYNWSTGSADSSITVTTSGVYVLTVTQNGCSGADTIQISEMGPPVVNLGPDTALCTGQTIFFKATANETSYLWSNGVEGPTIEVSEAGVYWVVVTNKCGIASDSVNVTMGPCDVGLPTAFSPNGDGSNDILYIRGAGIRSVDLQIFNRFGQMIFETTDMNIGWDGRFKGQPQEVDVYAYVLKALIIDGTSKVIKGNVTLLR